MSITPGAAMNQSPDSGTIFDRVRQVANVVLALSQASVTLLPRLAGIGEEIGTRSNAFVTAVTPAGMTFAVWAPLYAGSLAYAVDQARPTRRNDRLLRRIGWLTACAFLGNTLWALWVQSVRIDWTALIIIASTTGALIGALAVLKRQPIATAQRWLVQIPVSALAGWLSVAMFANFSATLKATGCTYFGFPRERFSATLVVLAGLLGVLVTVWSRRLSYALLVVWGLLGIVLGNLQRETDPLVGVTAAVMAAANLALAVWLFAPGRRSNPIVDVQ